MFSPIRWLRPRLKQFCIAFGVADMTLVILSVVWWYFFFDVAYQAQHKHLLAEGKLVKPRGDEHKDMLIASALLYKVKDQRSPDELRIERTKRACEFDSEDENFNINQNLTGPAALIGAAMGCYFILGALLASLSFVEWHAKLNKALCTFCLFCEGASTLFLLTAVSMFLTNEGMCPTEYYFEEFQPILYIFVFTLIFLCCYKMYEMNIIALYLSDEASKGLEEMDNKIAVTNVIHQQVSILAMNPAKVPMLPALEIQEKGVGPTCCMEDESEALDVLDAEGQGDKLQRKGHKMKRRQMSENLENCGVGTCPAVYCKGAQMPDPSEKQRKRSVDAGNQNDYETLSEESSRGSCKRKTSLKRQKDKACGKGNLEVQTEESSSRKASCSQTESVFPKQAQSSCQTERSIAIPPQISQMPSSCVCRSILCGQEANSRCCCEPPPPPPYCCCKNLEAQEECEPAPPKEVKYCVRVEVKCDDSCVQIEPNCGKSDEEGERRKSR